MTLDLKRVTQSLLSHPYFEKAKKVKELGPGHPEDSVYTHLVQTAEFVKEHRDGNFISNPEAKKRFQEYMAKEIAGVSYGDIAHNATLPDCWKLIGQMFEDPHFYSERSYFLA